MALIGWYRSWRGTGNGAWKKLKKNKKKPTTTKKKKQKNKNKRRTTTTTTTTTKKRTDDGFDPATLAEPAETKEITLWFFFYFLFLFFRLISFFFGCCCCCCCCCWVLPFVCLCFFLLLGEKFIALAPPFLCFSFHFFLLPGLGRSSFVFFCCCFFLPSFFSFLFFFKPGWMSFYRVFFSVSMEPSPKALYLVLLGFDLMTTSSFT